MEEGESSQAVGVVTPFALVPVCVTTPAPLPVPRADDEPDPVQVQAVP